MNRLMKTMAMREEESKTPYTNQLIQVKDDLDQLMKDNTLSVSVKLERVKDKLHMYRRLLKKSRILRGTPSAGTLMGTPTTPGTITPVTERRSRTPARREVVAALEPRQLFDPKPTPLFPTPPTTVGEEEGVRTRMQQRLLKAKRHLEELKDTPGSSGQKNKRAKKKKKKQQKGRGWTTSMGWVPEPGEPKEPVYINYYGQGGSLPPLEPYKMVPFYRWKGKGGSLPSFEPLKTIPFFKSLKPSWKRVRFARKIK